MVGVEAGERATGWVSMRHVFWHRGSRVSRRQTYVLQDDHGQISTTHSVPRPDYSAIGPEHALLHDSGRCVTCPSPIVRRWRVFSC